MFTIETLKALQESQSITAADAAIKVAENTVTALPSDYKLHDLEKYMNFRRRALGVMSTASLESFTAYTVLHAENGASVFVDSASMCAIAVLNLGTPDEPGHADNKAKLELQRTAAFKAVLGIATGTGYKQATIAEFIEDWPDQVKCFNVDGAIANSKAVAAIRKLTIETMRKLESEDQQLSTSRSAFESVQATSKEPIPTIIEFKCHPYADLTERTFSMRLAVKTEGDKPTISLRIVNFERHAEDMANELVELIASGFETPDIAVLVGSYTKA